MVDYMILISLVILMLPRLNDKIWLMRLTTVTRMWGGAITNHQNNRDFKTNFYLFKIMQNTNIWGKMCPFPIIEFATSLIGNVIFKDVTWIQFALFISFLNVDSTYVVKFRLSQARVIKNTLVRRVANVILPAWKNTNILCGSFHPIFQNAAYFLCL